MARLIQVLDQLPVCTRAYREGMGLSLDAAATEIGIPTSVLHGFEHGSDSRMQTLKRIVAWLEANQSTHERPVEINVEPPAPAARTATLEAEVKELRDQVEELRMAAGEVDKLLDQVEELRDQLAGADDIIVGFLGAAATKQFGTRRAQDVALCGCYIGPGSTGHSCGGG